VLSGRRQLEAVGRKGWLRREVRKGRSQLASLTAKFFLHPFGECSGGDLRRKGTRGLLIPFLRKVSMLRCGRKERRGTSFAPRRRRKEGAKSKSQPSPLPEERHSCSLP